MGSVKGAGVAPILRTAYPRVLSRMLAKTRDLEVAEDAVQDAVERALLTWPRDGVPEAPEAWLLTTAMNRFRDGYRKKAREEKHGDTLAALAETCPYGVWVLPETHGGFQDDLLRLLFTSADPVLGVSEAAALTLSTVLGLSGEELARAFVVPRRTMEQRLLRARKRLRTERKEYEVPRAGASSDRVDSVLCVVSLLFNEGYWSTGDAPPVRRDLCQLAIGLARSLYQLLPAAPEVAGLLALLLLHDARYRARLDEAGRPVALPDQDRTRYDHAQIAQGTALVKAALERGEPGPFQIEAAIAAVHCSAETADQTDWPQIAALYELLEEHRPTGVVRVNRAFALARADGVERGLDLLADVDFESLGYGYAWLVRGCLLAERGDRGAARGDFEQALALAKNEHEVAEIRRRIRELGSTPPAPRAD